MKQKYIKPTAKVYQMKTRHNLLEGSTQVSISNQAYNGGGILSREGGSSWDDDDE